MPTWLGLPVGLEMPPLRERGEDLPLLVEHFLARLNERHGVSVRGVTRRALRLLQQHPWRGNVRELETILEQTVIFRRGEWITPEDLDLPARRPTEALGSPACAGRQGMAAAKAALSWLQHEVLRIAAERREVRRRDVIAQCRVSHEVARRALSGLVQLRLLRRVGLGRAARYVPLSCWLTVMSDVAEWSPRWSEGAGGSTLLRGRCSCQHVTVILARIQRCRALGDAMGLGYHAAVMRFHRSRCWW